MSGTDFVVLFLSGVNEVFPYIQSHNVLSNLQSTAKEKPTIMFFPEPTPTPWSLDHRSISSEGCMTTSTTGHSTSFTTKHELDKHDNSQDHFQQTS
jgi:hypothetical protein